MYEKTVFSSGLKLFLVPFDQVGSVTFLFFVGAGSRYEKKHQSGISHFLEHMFFKGTKKRPTPREISVTIDQLGGEINAGTAKNYTVFVTKVATQHFDHGLELLADILQNSLFNPKEIEKEKGVIAEEIRMYYDAPYRYISQLYDQLIWGNTPLGRDIAGDIKTVQSFKQKDFLSYINSLYTFDNIIVGIGGKFDKIKAVSSVKAIFQNFGGKKQIIAPRNTKQQSAPQFLLHHRKTEQAHICLGVTAYPNNHPDKFNLLVLETILGGNMSSRLFTTIREELGLAYMISTSISQYSDVGTLMIQAGLQLTQTELAIKTILLELKKLKKQKVDPKELSMAKEYLKGKLTLSLDDPEGVTDWICRQELLLGHVKTIEKIISEIEKVTEEDILRIANEIFTPQRLNLAIIGPFKQADRFKNLLHL